MHRSSDWCTLRQISGFGLMKMPLRWFLLAVVVFLVGVTIGLEVTGRLEPFLEPVVAYFSHEHRQQPPKLRLVPVDYNPFLPYFDI